MVRAGSSFFYALNAVEELCRPGKCLKLQRPRMFHAMQGMMVRFHL